MKVLQSLLHFFGIFLPAALIAALVLIVLADVVTRNFFATSIMWAHDLAIIALAAAVWLGLSGAAASGQLFGISLLVDRLPPQAAAAVQLLADLMIVCIAAAVIRASWSQISTARFTIFLSLGWPKWIVAALLACGMGLIILGRLLDIAARLRRPAT